MSFFTNIRADRFITELKTATDVAAPATQKAIAKLRELGPGAIEPVTAALADADKIATVAYIEVLTGLVNQKTFPKFIESMVTGSPRVVAGVAWALSSSRAYPPTMLLDALGTEGIAKSALLDVITAHRSRLSVREILAAAYKQEANEKAALFRILGELATDNDLPELVGRLNGKDPVARLHIINILSRFPKPEVQRALQQQLKDTNKLVRAATLGALAKMDGPIEIEQVCALLRDPEIDVQNKAIDVVIRANDPETIKYLIPVLKDENEYARRAAVEVLNEIGNAKSVKELLEAVADDDWWVRQPRRGRARQDRRPQGRRSRAAAGRRPGRRHPPRRRRDPQPDQGRSRGRPPHRSHQGQGLVGQRTRRRRAGRNRQQARRAAPHRNARHHSAAIPAGGGARARPPRRLQGHRRRAAHADARRKGHPARGHLLARQARRRTPAREHPRADPGADSATPNRPSRRPRCARCPISTRASRGSGTRLSSTQNRSPVIATPAVARSSATQASSTPAHGVGAQRAAARPSAADAPPPPPPRAASHRRTRPPRSRRARSSCPSRTCSAR